MLHCHCERQRSNLIKTGLLCRSTPRNDTLFITFVLVDATALWIREIEVYGSIVAYSYYWLRHGGSTIVGWDNAPHHKEVQTFPHHKHIGKNIEPSEQTDVRKVMKFIGDFLG